MVAFFDVQQGRCLVHMEETEEVFVLPHPKVMFPRERLLQSQIFQDFSAVWEWVKNGFPQIKKI